MANNAGDVDAKLINHRMQDIPYIWLPDEVVYDKDNPVVVLFRRDFQVDDIPEVVYVNVSADSRYRLTVNGENVCCGPCKGDRYAWYYERVNIAPFLRRGKNTIGAKVLRYPLAHGKGSHSILRTPYPNFYFVEENERFGISADREWHCRICTGLMICPGLPETRAVWMQEKTDGSLIDKGWDQPDFTETNEWLVCKVYRNGQIPREGSPREPKERPIPLLYESASGWEKVSCVRQSDLAVKEWEKLLAGQNGYLILKAGSEHVMEFDAGELMTAYPELYFTGGKGSFIELLYAESYWLQNPDGTYIKGDREDSIHGKLIGETDEYKVAGSGTCKDPEYFSTFWFKTFRFCRIMVKVGEEDLCIHKFAFRATGYPLNVTTQVKTSDEKLNHIWDICLRTLKRCMHETYEDCPYYEQHQYGMDTRTQILFTYSVSGDDRLARRCIDDFHRSLRPDGLTDACYPITRPFLIPGFSLYYIFMIYDHMMYFGDKNLVKKYLLTAERILQFFDDNLTREGILGCVGGYSVAHERWSFIDWVEGWRDGVPDAVLDGPLTMESMLYLMALNYVSEMAAFIGRDDLAKYYAGKAESLKAAIRRECYDEEQKLFEDGPGYRKDYSQHVQVFAILSGLVQGEEAAALLENMLSRDDLAVCSVAMSYYLFRAVEMAGYYDKVIEKMWEPWREMLMCNLTTCVESLAQGRSDCHAWGAVALYEVPAVILGVKPLAYGYEKMLIAPHAAYLDWAEGVVTTPKGNVKVKWSKEEDGKISVEYENISYTGEIIICSQESM